MSDNPDKLSPQEIVLITRAEHQPSDFWSEAEKIAKVVSLVAIPVVLAVVGWLVQDKLATRTVSKDYVQLALSILTQPAKEGADPALRDWAVKLLNANSPTKFSTGVINSLKNGTVTLPADNLRLLGRDYLDQTQALGSEHPATLATLANLAAAYAAKGDYGTAEQMYRHALATTEKVLGPNDPRIAQLLMQLAALFEKMGRTNDAQTFRQRADSIYKSLKPTP